MIRVLVVDDHPMARAAMVDMVVSTTSLVLVGTATDGRAGVALAERIRPDVVLVDMSMSAMSCIEATQRLVGKHPTMRVIMFNGEGRPSVVEAAQEAGAAGFLRRGSSESEVIRVIRSVMAGLPMWPAESRP